jgi:TonB family protein
MGPRPARVALALALAGLLVGGCGQKAAAPAPPATVPLVVASQRSAHFERVSRELDLGGTLYGFVDLDGDPQKIAAMIQSVLDPMNGFPPQVCAYWRPRIPRIVSDLGLDDLAAVGVSSVPQGGGQFRNRAFLYTPRGRHGLFQMFGGPPAPFARLSLAPYDADFFAETEIDLPALYATIQRVLEDTQGASAGGRLDDQLQQIGLKGVWSVLDLIHALRGRITLTGRFDRGRTAQFGGPPAVVIPRLLLVARLDGVGPVADRLLGKAAAGSRSTVGSRVYYNLDPHAAIQGLTPEAMVDGQALYLTTSAEFLEECLTLPAERRLDANPTFQRVMADLGTEGNALSYVTQGFFHQLRLLPDLNRDWPMQTRTTLYAALDLIPEDPEPLAALRTNLPDGILVRAHYNRSFKREAILSALYNPVTLAALISAQRLQQPAPDAARWAPGNGLNARAAVPARLAFPLLPGERAAPPLAAPGSSRNALPLRQAAAVYPADLVRHQVSGVVEVEFLVDVAGAVREAEARMSSDPELAAAAVAAVKEWSFAPALRDGQPVESRLQTPMIFTQSKEQPLLRGLRAATSWYSRVQQSWLSDQMARNGGRLGAALDELVWVRIGIGDSGEPAVMEAGRGAADPEADLVRAVVGQSWGLEANRRDLMALLREVGHLDVAFPVYEAPTPPIPAAAP